MKAKDILIGHEYIGEGGEIRKVVAISFGKLLYSKPGEFGYFPYSMEDFLKFAKEEVKE
jgi:hypothetical protein